MVALVLKDAGGAVCARRKLEVDLGRWRWDKDMHKAKDNYKDKENYKDKSTSRKMLSLRCLLSK